MRTRSIGLVTVLALAAAPARAVPPEPIDATQFAFPGSFDQPPSAASAGFGLADSWLGDEPFSNPAARGSREVTVSPTALWFSRQDLRADNRNYSDAGASFDLAGAAIALPYVPVWVYVYQPVLRFESYTYTRGTGIDPSVQPATITGESDTREGRAGVAGSVGFQRLRAGAALEWSRREDRYFTREQSGAPDQGDREVTFDGNAFGGTFGLRYDSADSGARRVTIGVAARYLPALTVDGQQTENLLSGSTTTPVSAERESGWEGGVSARYYPTTDLALIASGGGRSQQEWKGFDLVSGAAFSWRVAMEYHDTEDPWTVRFGLGQDQQDQAPEPRAGVVGIGVGWDIQGTLLEAGILHRSIERDQSPNSYEDRLIASVRVGF
jgi:hypothetical protein